MRGWQLGIILFFAAVLAGCSTSKSAADQRAEVRAVGRESIQILPTAGQLAYCLAFTASESGVVRQLTMPPDRMSVPCPEGQPVGGLVYKIPAREGKVKIYLLFSDQQLKADPIAAQVYELASSGRAVTVMDLRAPGKVQLGMLEFTPAAGPAAQAVEGDAVTRDAGAGDAASPADTADTPR
jgi:hypothetical protein